MAFQKYIWAISKWKKSNFQKYICAISKWKKCSFRYRILRKILSINRSHFARTFLSVWSPSPAVFAAILRHFWLVGWLWLASGSLLAGHWVASGWPPRPPGIKIPRWRCVKWFQGGAGEHYQLAGRALVGPWLGSGWAVVGLLNLANFPIKSWKNRQI